MAGALPATATTHSPEVRKIVPAQGSSAPSPAPPEGLGSRASQRAGLLLLAGALLGMLSMPRNIVALVALLPAAWFFLQALREQVGRARLPVVLWTALGLLLVSVLVVGVGLPYLFYDQSMAIQDCLQGANTQQAEADCTTDWTTDLSRFTQGR